MTQPARTRAWLISAVVLPVSFLMYLFSLTVDVATSRTTITVFGTSNTTEDGYRLLSTIRSLYESGEWVLAVAITAFTIVFPISKYFGLSYVLFGPSPRGRRESLRWITGALFNTSTARLAVSPPGSPAPATAPANSSANAPRKHASRLAVGC